MQEKIDIAKRSLKQGLDIETVKAITGLSDDELKDLVD